jgi:hypothetical protein
MKRFSLQKLFPIFLIILFASMLTVQSCCTKKNATAPKDSLRESPNKSEPVPGQEIFIEQNDSNK